MKRTEHNFKKLLLISGDYGAYNPFNVISERIKNYDIEVLHLNRRDNEKTNYKDFINIVPLIGTSSDPWFEKKWIEKLIDNKIKINIFIDEVYNLEKRLSFLEGYKENINNIFYPGILDLDTCFPAIKKTICRNPSFSKEHLIQRFDYEFNHQGPIVIIDEYKEEFRINKIFLEKKYKNINLSNVLEQEFSINDNQDIKIRSHPKSDLDKNYLSGEASGFIGYSSMALAELSFMGFKVMSIASNEVISTSTSIFKLNDIKEKSVIKPIDLKSIFNFFKKPNDSKSSLSNQDILPLILDLL